jgi:phage terminase large subunit-like protein
MTKSAQPRFCTERTPDRRNLLTAANGIAKALGFELMPWQSDFLALFTELRPEDSHFAFKEGTLLLPRQQGKSTLALVLLLLRCLTTPNTHTVYGAQTLKDSRSMLIDTWEPMLRQSALTGTYKVRAANGSERITFSNGSSIELITSTM